MANAVIGVEGMTCDHCVKRVTDGLSSVEGVSNVTVSLEQKQAEVVYDSDDTLAKLKEKVVDLGYTVV